MSNGIDLANRIARNLNVPVGADISQLVAVCESLAELREKYEGHCAAVGAHPFEEGMLLMERGVAKILQLREQRDALLAACWQAKVFMEIIGNPAPPHPWMQICDAIAKAEAKS